MHVSTVWSSRWLLRSTRLWFLRWWRLLASSLDSWRFGCGPCRGKSTTTVCDCGEHTTTSSCTHTSSRTRNPTACCGSKCFKKLETRFLKPRSQALQRVSGYPLKHGTLILIQKYLLRCRISSSRCNRSPNCGGPAEPAPTQKQVGTS